MGDTYFTQRILLAVAMTSSTLQSMLQYKARETNIMAVINIHLLIKPFILIEPPILQLYIYSFEELQNDN
ncbi:MAG: hypothetical protein ACI8RD_003795 [Bacillariaceae sp.]|jgi:hypothetical protein